MISTQFYKPGKSILSLTFANWTEKWWQYFLANPLDHFAKQSDVWFFASEFVTENPPPSYNIQITANTPCLIPILNQCSTPESLDNTSASDQHLNDDCTSIINTAQGAQATITFPDGTASILESHRVHTLVFQVTYGPGSRYPGAKTRGAADGFWVFIQGLQADKKPYIIKLAGIMESEFKPGDFLDVTGATFNITVS